MTDTNTPQQSTQGLDFQRLGLNQVAYVKVTEVDREIRYMVHTADGTAVTAFPSEALARMAIREHELEPVSIH
jgi:hypothetical protein